MDYATAISTEKKFSFFIEWMINNNQHVNLRILKEELVP